SSCTLRTLLHLTSFPPRRSSDLDAPHQAPLRVAPGPEVLHVQVTHGQHGWRRGDVTHERPPAGRPPVERGAEERKDPGAHRVMLELEIRLDEGNPLGEPRLVARRRRDDPDLAPIFHGGYNLHRP